MITKSFDQFTVYQDSISSAFVYANFDDANAFMNGFADYILSEDNLLNYANTLTPIEFVPNKIHYKKLYSTLSSFLNKDLELLTYNNVSDEVLDVLGQEYTFIDQNGETLLQKDKIGKIGEYIFHLLLTKYYNVQCIIPKFRCTTDRNMSVFGIDALFYNPKKNVILFGESKVCKNISSAITLINRSFQDYEQQISEEYKLVLSNENYNLSSVFTEAFNEHTAVCISFEDFIKEANITKICVPAFIAHGKKSDGETIENYLKLLNSKITRNKYFGLDTEYLFISLPIIDKSKMMDTIMKKVVEKNGKYKSFFFN